MAALPFSTPRFLGAGVEEFADGGEFWTPVSGGAGLLDPVGDAGITEGSSSGAGAASGLSAGSGAGAGLVEIATS